MIANPIIQREFFGVLRRPQTLAMFVAMLTVLAGVIIGMWPDTATVSLDGRQAQQLFGVFIYGLCVCLMLVVPAYPATAIVRELRRNTLVLLLTSPLKPVDILLGKISAAVGIVLLLLIVSAPASIACLVMGGIGPGQVIEAYSVLGLMSVQYAVVALLVSSFARSADGSLRMTYAAVLVLAVLVLGPYKLLQGQPIGPLADVIHWVYCLSPIPAITELLGHGDVASQGYIKSFNPVNRYMITALATIALSVAWLMVRLRPTLLDRSRDAGTATDDRSAQARAVRRFVYLWFFDPHRRSSAIGRFTNPVMVKEFRTRTLGRSYWMARAVSACLITSLALVFATAAWATRNAEAHKAAFLGGVLVVVQMALVVLTTPALSAGLISDEYESGGWPLLQVTRLRAHQIVIGKLVSVVVTLLLLLGATMPAYVVMWYVDPAYIWKILDVLVIVASTAVCLMMMSAACSAVFRRTVTATTVAYGVSITLCVGTMIVWLGRGSLFGEALVAKALSINPVAAALAAMRLPGFEPYQSPDTWRWLLIAAAACGVVLWAATWRINRPK